MLPLRRTCMCSATNGEPSSFKSFWGWGTGEGAFCKKPLPPVNSFFNQRLASQQPGSALKGSWCTAWDKHLSPPLHNAA